MSKPKKHAKFAASSSERWVNCPSSLRLYEWAIAQPNVKLIESTSAAAEEGTKAHELMEVCLETGVKNVAKMYERDIGTDYVNEEMLEHVQSFVDYVRENLQPHHEMLVEKRVELPFLHKTEAFGTVDVAIIEPFGTLHIIDFKYGRGFVNHKDNTQMIFYALGLAHELGFDIDSVKTTIYQPRVSGRPDRTDTFSVEKLHHYKKVFENAIKCYSKGDNESDLNAGAWCKFCPVKIICPAITTGAMEKAKLDFAAPMQPSPKALTSDQLKTILDRSAYLELWVKEVKKYAEEQIRAGVKIEGWGLEPKRAQRKWVNPSLFHDGKTSNVHGYNKVKEYGVKFLTTETKSVHEVEKELKAAKVPKELIERFLKDNTVSVSSGDKLSQTTKDMRDLQLDDVDTY